MKNFTLITSLILCSVSWVSVSVSAFQIMRSRPGDEVTLLIANISKHETVTFWFRLFNKTKPNCISVMVKSDSTAAFCDGYENNFEMRSNISYLFLKIKKVSLSDSGLYFCAFYLSGRPTFSIVDLQIEGGDEVTGDVIPKETGGPIVMTLCGVVTYLMIIVGFVKIRDSKRAACKEPQQCENVDSGGMKDAAHRLYSRTLRHRRPPSESKVETHVIYTAGR
ncbi:uncharacterized protein LOC115059061 [Echeneis naucrates]|uniref:Uncharacterized LOC115059061 n=1 Tax=Echeneis naucrates TaxID=173247 RepID=A0A665VK09_ECHNA|nr:uncharacterized protein LOC115059061 [Echeneis naucrates]